MLLEKEKELTRRSEMFLGPAPDGFKFQPKHKSNSYEAEG
jgi:tRNA-dihydrouridine synthase 3